MLRHALAESSADEILTGLLAQDALVYAGYSAGCCVLAPSLRGLELVDEPEAVAETYGVPPIWDGLGLLEYAVVPHVDSPGHPETEACGRLAEHYRATESRTRRCATARRSSSAERRRPDSAGPSAPNESEDSRPD